MQFLMDPIQCPKLQLILDHLLISLNSSWCECNLLLDSANALNLRAFRPPKPPALPVPDHAVAILVREDLLSLVSGKDELYKSKCDIQLGFGDQMGSVVH